tara:strand:- start:2797 stop:3867 length:1071 start_codon:yes stop_codon:yes gene_type:complete
MKEILIYGPIGSSVTARDVVRQFQEARGDDVLLRIHSEGGSVLEGEAILNAIRQHDATVFGQIDGMAFSMAAIIALEVRDNLTMPEDGWIMLHDVRAGGAGGTEQDLERALVQVKAMNASIATKVSNALGISEEDAAAKLKDEIWMNGQEALAAGLVSAITPAEALAAQYWSDEWQNVPIQFLRSTRNPVPNEADAESTPSKPEMKLFKLFHNDKVEPSLELAEIGPEDLGAELAEAQKNLDEANASNIAALVARDETHALALTNALDEQRAEIEAKHAEAIAEKDAAIEAAENSSEKQANEILAQAGHSPVETVEPEEKTVKEQYLDLKPGEERQKFRNEHREELKDAFGSGVLR